MDQDNPREDYSGTITSSGVVLARPDRLRRTKYTYGPARNRLLHTLRSRKSLAVLVMPAGESSPEAIAASLEEIGSPMRDIVVKATTPDESERAFKGVTIVQERLMEKGIKSTVTLSPESGGRGSRSFRFAIEPPSED